MSKNSKQGRISIRTSTQEARTVLDPAKEAERALNRALGQHFRKVEAELHNPRDGWIVYLEGLEYYGASEVIESSLESLTGSPERNRETFAAVLALEIWASDCEYDIWANTFEEEMYWLEALYEIPLSERHW